MKISNYKYLFTLLCVLNIATNKLFTQVSAIVFTEEVEITEEEYIFDLYIHTVEGSEGDLFLAQSDFIINFDSKGFTDPVVSKVPNPEPIFGFLQNGYCTFSSTNYNDPNDLMTALQVQYNYYGGTSIMPVSDNEIRILLTSGTASTNAQLHNFIARINGEENLHRLGRFKINGYNGEVEDVNLTVKSSGPYFTTKLYTNTETEFPVAERIVLTNESLNSIATNRSSQLTDVSLQKSRKSLRIYPNPTTGIINLDIQEIISVTNDITIKIYDEHGTQIKDVCKNDCSEKWSSFDMSEYNNGLYFIKVQTPEDLHIDKFILMK